MKPAIRLHEKFPSLMQNTVYGCQRNVRKNITVTVSVRVSVTVRVSLGWFVSSNSLVELSVAISWIKPATYLYQFSNAV